MAADRMNMPAIRRFAAKQPSPHHLPSLRHWERADKLAWIEQQIASGELVIRQATQEERLRYGIGSRPVRKPAGRRGSNQTGPRPPP